MAFDLSKIVHRTLVYMRIYFLGGPKSRMIFGHSGVCRRRRSLPQMAPMDADEFISKSANVCVICGLVHHRWPLCAFEWGVPACLGSSASGATAEALDTFDVPKSLEEEVVSRVKVVGKAPRI